MWLLSRTHFRPLARYVPLLVIPWILGAALKSGYLSWLRTKPAVFFISSTQLSGGSGDFSRFRRYQELSRFFRFPSVSFVERNFKDPERLQDWQSTLPSGSVAVSIRDDAFEVSLPVYSGAAAAPDRILVEQIEGYQLHNSSRQYLLLPRSLAGQEFFLALPARTATISSKSIDQSLHFIGWFAKVASSWVWNTPIDDNNRAAAIAELQRIEDSAAQLHMLSGWNNDVAKIICRLVQGNVMLLEALVQGGDNRQLIELAARQYRSAYKLLNREQSPELESALRNNFAVALLLLAEDQTDITKARVELLRAAGQGDNAPQVPIGSRLALINITQARL